MPLLADNTGQAQTFTDFPVLVVLTPGRCDYAAVRADGADLGFFGDQGSALAYEWELWNPGATSHARVKLPSVPGSSQTRFWL